MDDVFFNLFVLYGHYTSIGYFFHFLVVASRRKGCFGINGGQPGVKGVFV